MSNKPKYRIVAKSKQSGNFQDLIALWDGERGVSGRLDRSIVKVVLDDGRVITNENAWLNMYLSDEQDQTRPVANEHDQREPQDIEGTRRGKPESIQDDSSIPF